MHARTPPIKATHSETNEKVVIYNGLAFTTESFLQPGYPTEVDLDVLDSFEWPELGVYRHFKGGLYRTVGACLMAKDQTPAVLYQALYGASEHFVRPLASWMEEAVGADGAKVARFTRVPTGT